MPVATLFLIIVVVVVLLVGAIVGLPMLAANRERLDREQRIELRELKKFKHDVKILTARQRDVNPELATQIDGLLYDFDTKELG